MKKPFIFLFISLFSLPVFSYPVWTYNTYMKCQTVDGKIQIEAYEVDENTDHLIVTNDLGLQIFSGEPTYTIKRCLKCDPSVYIHEYEFNNVEGIERFIQIRTYFKFEMAVSKPEIDTKIFVSGQYVTSRGFLIDKGPALECSEIR